VLLLDTGGVVVPVPDAPPAGTPDARPGGTPKPDAPGGPGAAPSSVSNGCALARGGPVAPVLLIIFLAIWLARRRSPRSPRSR